MDAHNPYLKQAEEELDRAQLAGTEAERKAHLTRARLHIEAARSVQYGSGKLLEI